MDTELPGVKIVIPQMHRDNRGYFMESFNERRLQELGLTHQFVQDNRSVNVEAGTLRGLHFQTEPKAQVKLVSAPYGAVYDVAVDIRPGSPTFGRWTGVILSETNGYQLFIPAGFAHGYCTLVPNSQLFYKVDEYYSPENDGGIAWDDPDLAIRWPTVQPILSEKDKRLPRLREWAESMGYSETTDSTDLNKEAVGIE